jgi:hypothetical protein
MLANGCPLAEDKDAVPCGGAEGRGSVGTCPIKQVLIRNEGDQTATGFEHAGNLLQDIAVQFGQIVAFVDLVAKRQIDGYFVDAGIGQW